VGRPASQQHRRVFFHLKTKSERRCKTTSAKKIAAKCPPLAKKNEVLVEEEEDPFFQSAGVCVHTHHGDEVLFVPGFMLHARYTQ
jgi:hypothetical protein